MTLRELLNVNDELMRELKEQWVASNPDKPELAIYIYAWREEVLVASVQTPLDGARALQTAAIAATGFNADVIGLTFESWVTTLDASPLTGKPWREGEMNFVARTYPDAFEKGWLTEQLATIVHDRGDGFLMSKHQFTINGKTVNWGDREVTDRAVPKGDDHPIREVMHESKMLEKITEAADDNPLNELLLNTVLDEETRLFHCDVATIKALEQRGLASSVMLFADAGSERQKLIEERAGDIGLVADGPVGAEPMRNRLQQVLRDDFYGTDK